MQSVTLQACRCHSCTSDPGLSRQLPAEGSATASDCRLQQSQQLPATSPVGLWVSCWQLPGQMSAAAPRPPAVWRGVAWRGVMSSKAAEAATHAQQQPCGSNCVSLCCVCPFQVVMFNIAWSSTARMSGALQRKCGVATFHQQTPHSAAVSAAGTCPVCCMHAPGFAEHSPAWRRPVLRWAAVAGVLPAVLPPALLYCWARRPL